MKPEYSGHSQLVAIERWPDYMYFQQGGPLWNTISWLFYRDDLLIHCSVQVCDMWLL